MNDPVHPLLNCLPADSIGEDISLEQAEAILRQLGGEFDTTPPAPPRTSRSSAATDARSPHPRIPEIGVVAEHGLLESEGFHGFLEAMPDAVILVNQGGLIVQVNVQTERLFGYPRAELLGQPIELLVPERFRVKHIADRENFFVEPRVRPMGLNLELSGRGKDGREVPVEISLSPLRSGAETFVVSTIRDISERRRREARLRKLEARYRTLVEGIPAVTFMASLDEEVPERELYVSPQIETLLGFSQKEWLEDPILWYTRLHPDDRTRWHDEFARTVAEGRPFCSQYRFIARDGRMVWVHGEAKVVRDEPGRPQFLQGIAFDITAIKEAELELKQMNQKLDERVKKRTQELEHSRAKLEVFAYTASHDLKEPLRGIKADTQRLQRLLESLMQNIQDIKHDMLEPLRAINSDTGQLLCSLQGEEGKINESLTHIIGSAVYMAGLLQDLEDYAQVGSGGTPASVDCNRAFEAACNLLRAAIADSGAVVTAEPLPSVFAIEREVVRLFQNLINNAIKFREPDRPIRIAIGARQEGHAWVLWVQDNGMGIRAKHLDGRIFGIGQQSRLHVRSKIPGTGFGLAICKHIIESFKGKIWVESEFGQGSIFYFTLPADRS